MRTTNKLMQNKGEKQGLLMSAIESTLLDFFKSYPEKTILIAYSGGVDSQVLLHALSHLFKQKKLTNPISACHVNHGLSPNAEGWQLFAQQQCDVKNITINITKVDIQKKSQQSLEALAREARYNAIKHVITANTLVVTGHHNDDQAETFLLALKRGSGLKGLSAMKAVMPLAEGMLVRPLLNVSRIQIENYAKENKLEWIEDESNQDTRFDRNFIRHEVMPVLINRWPSLLTTINRSVEHCQEGDELLTELAKQDLQECDALNNKLNVEKLLLLSKARFNNVVRYFLSQHDCLMPAKAQLEQLYSQLNANEDKTPEVKVGDLWLRRYKGFLYLTPELNNVSLFSTQLDNSSNQLIELPDNIGTIQLHYVSWDYQNVTINKNKQIINIIPPKAGQKITVSFNHNNPVCLPDYRQKSRSLKKVLQELDIPPWQRKRIPFIYFDNELVSALGYFICKPYMTNDCSVISEGDQVLQITWKGHLSDIT